jgi:hypothetical protein
MKLASALSTCKPLIWVRAVMDPPEVYCGIQ